MAGSLLRLQEIEVTSSVSTVDVGGNTYWDSSYNVYLVRVENLKVSTDGTTLLIRVLTNGTAQTDSTYYQGGYGINSGGFYNNSQAGISEGYAEFFIGNASGENANGDYFLFNFNNSSNYSFWTYEGTSSGYLDYSVSWTGGGMKKIAEANNGVQFSLNIGTIESAKITLFGLRK